MARRINYLPVFRIPLQHQRIFRLADLARIFIFDFLDVFLGLDSFIFGEGPMMAFLM